MGRGGPGVFDSDMAWEDADELSALIGINLASAGSSPSSQDAEEDEPPTLTIKQSAAYLNDGQFNRVFDSLRLRRRYYELVLFVLLSMRVGAKVSSKYKKYIKKRYKKIDAWDNLPESRAQIRVALKEYKSGTPYKLRDFNFEDSQAEDPSSSSDSEKEDQTCSSNRNIAMTSTKRCRECEDDCEKEKGHDEAEAEPTAKKARIAESASEAN